jgi:membrane protease subunit HflK
MSWNEPGGDKKDPWSGRDNQKGPPDLDEALRSLQEKLGKIFGGRGGNGGSPGARQRGLGYLAAGALILWGMSGFYIVDEGWRGVETRFGKYTATTQPGLQWHLPVPIEQVQLVNVGQQRIIEIGSRGGSRQQSASSASRDTLMLTTDENIVDVHLTVQYQVKQPEKFLFNVLNPDLTLRQVTESVERGVIGKSKMDFILTEGRSEIVNQIQKEVQEIMDSYGAGIRITTVNLQDAQAPQEVQGAFQDVIKAREDKQRLINEAEAYANDVVPKAGGAAARKIQEAEGYKAKVVAQAEGEASRFSKLLTEYKKAPEVMRKRLYLDAIESVLQNTDTVMVDVKGGNNVLYLPLDAMSHDMPPGEGQADVTESGAPQSTPSTSTYPTSLRHSVRGREPRGR